jgi:hypothetical protein
MNFNGRVGPKLEYFIKTQSLRHIAWNLFSRKNAEGYFTLFGGLPPMLTFQAAVAAAPLGVYRAQTSDYSLIPASMDPLVIQDKLWMKLRDDARLILFALQKLGAVLRQDPGHRLFAQLAPLEKEAADFAGLATARLDLFFDGDDLKVIEANTTIPAMQAYSDMIRRAYGEAFHPQKKIEHSNSDDLLHSLLEHYERTGGKSARPRLAIVARAGDSQRAELFWLQRAWQAQGYETLLLTPDEIEIRKGLLWGAAQPLDLVYRHIFAHRLAPNSAFARACLQAERYRVFNPIAAHLEAKGVLAELSRYAADPQLGLSIGLKDDEVDATVRRVAWSRLLERGPASLPDGTQVSDLISWVKERPQELVVKSSLGYGGHGIFIGSSFSEKSSLDRARKLLAVSHEVSWPELIEALLKMGGGQWIVQRKVSGRKIRHRFWSEGQWMEKETFIDCSIFTNSGVNFRPHGGACRFSTDAIVNIGQGGGLMPLLLESELR